MTDDVSQCASFGRALFYNFTMPVSTDDQLNLKVTYTSLKIIFLKQKGGGVADPYVRIEKKNIHSRHV